MPNISIMIKPASSMCNLRCKYCFYESLSKQRDTQNYGLMNSSTTHNLIDKSLELSNGGDIYYAFQGGEPLLAGYDYYLDFINYFNKKSNGKKNVVFSLQTNGTLIDKKWANLFKKYGFLIGLSLDGNQNANRFRKDSDNNYAFPKIIDGLSMLREYNVEFNILVVATKYTAHHIPEIMEFFKKNNLKFLQFIPCLRPFNCRDESELFMDINDYYTFLDTLFSIYCKSIFIEKDYISIRYFDNLVNIYLGLPCEQCGMLGRCSHQFVIEGNGNVYPCDFYCIDKWLLGNINNDSLITMAKSKNAIEFLKESLNVPEKCKNCSFYSICKSGGCKRQREDRDYCEAYKKFFYNYAPLFAKFKNLN